MAWEWRFDFSKGFFLSFHLGILSSLPTIGFRLHITYLDVEVRYQKYTTGFYQNA